MKKDYYIVIIVLSVIFCACSIGIDIIYWEHYPAFYLAGIVVGSIAFVISIVCLSLKLTKKDRQERYNKMLAIISMKFATVAVCLLIIGTLITMFN